MHRDVVTLLTTAGRFAATVSRDGQLKLWARDTAPSTSASSPELLHFVKAFRVHTAAPLALSSAPDGSIVASTGADRTLKLFDVAAFDLTDFATLPFQPSNALCFARSESAAALFVLVADSESRFSMLTRWETFPQNRVCCTHRISRQW